MATTFLELVKSIQSTPYAYPNEAVAKWEKLRGLVDEVYADLQRRCVAIATASPEERDAFAGHSSRWRLEVALDAMRVQIDQRIADITKEGRAVQQWVTKSDTTLAALSYQLDVNIDDLIGLNPKLLFDQLVPKGTTVYYYPTTTE